MAFDWKSMPPALVPGSPLGHEGLPSEAVEHLRGLGYEPQDVRTAIGPRQLELWLQGMVLGTVEADPAKFKVLEAARKHYSKTSKEATEAGLRDLGGKVDVVSLLLNKGPQGNEAPRARRGRPPGPSK